MRDEQEPEMSDNYKQDFTKIIICNVLMNARIITNKM
jgi:hypothetical protein